MGDLRTVRWTRNDDDRLYVMQSDGIQVGWVDLVTGERHLVATAMRAEVDAALAAYAGAVPGLPALLARNHGTAADDRHPARPSLDGDARTDVLGTGGREGSPDEGSPSADEGGADGEAAEPRLDPSTTRLGAWWRDGWR